jgi:hypothetical protein
MKNRQRYLLLIASLVLFGAVTVVFWRQNIQPTPIPLTPSLTGQVEYCLTCHSDIAEISPSHPVKTFGCVACHGGLPLALDAGLAHSTMRGGSNPSDFTVVETSCGGDNCHSGSPESYMNHIQRATTSIQATYAGAIAIIRYTFGDQLDLKAVMGVTAVSDPSSTSGISELAAFVPALEPSLKVQEFGQNCLTCHLEAQALPGDNYLRYTGCAACHTPTQPKDRFTDKAEPTTQIHRLTTSISYTQCDTCHNRGNYDLRSMTFDPRQDLPTDKLHDYYQPIAQFTSCEWTLDCIDCHTRTEAMGDGSLYSSKKDIQYIQCKTCHGTLTELPKTHVLTDPNDLALRLAFLNPVVTLNPGDTILVTDNGESLWNIKLLSDGTYDLIGKATGESYIFRPVMGSGCLQDPARQDSASCHQCHSVQR